MSKKRTGMTLSWSIVDNTNKVVENQYQWYGFNNGVGNRDGWDPNPEPAKTLTRKSARALKNFLNAFAPDNAPFRIVQTTISK